LKIRNKGRLSSNPQNMPKLILFSLLTAILISAPFLTLAQDETLPDSAAGGTVEQDVELDESVQAQDLGISEPTLLPDSPFYFLKNWQRSIQSFFTFGAVNEAELKLKFASEKLLEARKLAEKKEIPEILEKAAQNYEEEINKIKETVDKIKEKADEKPEVGKFLDKFVKQQVLHQKILEKLETQVPEEVFQKIEETRERHLERFGEVMEKLEENKERIQERLEKNLGELEGSQFKELKNLEILKELEEKVPEKTKEAVRNVIESTSQKMKQKLEQMTPQTQEKLENYIEKIQGDEENKIEIIEEIKSKLEEKPEITERLEKVKEKILFKLETSPLEIIEKESEEKCIKEGTETGLGLSEAKTIAKAGECGQKGILKETASCNKVTGTWWIDLDVNDEVWKGLDVSKDLCNPACVVDVLTKEAEINWRCTGLTLPSGE